MVSLFVKMVNWLNHVSSITLLHCLILSFALLFLAAALIFTRLKAARDGRRLRMHIRQRPALRTASFLDEVHPADGQSFMPEIQAAHARINHDKNLLLMQGILFLIDRQEQADLARIRQHTHNSMLAAQLAEKYKALLHRPSPPARPEAESHGQEYSMPGGTTVNVPGRRPRGRPRKTPEIYADAARKRPRGRPRKPPSEDSARHTLEKRPRGRPRKTME